MPARQLPEEADYYGHGRPPRDLRGKDSGSRARAFAECATHARGAVPRAAGCVPRVSRKEAAVAPAVAGAGPALRVTGARGLACTACTCFACLRLCLWRGFACCRVFSRVFACFACVYAPIRVCVSVQLVARGGGLPSTCRKIAADSCVLCLSMYMLARASRHARPQDGGCIWTRSCCRKVSRRRVRCALCAAGEVCGPVWLLAVRVWVRL